VADTLHFAFEAGHHGRRTGPPGIRVRELTDFALASVLARKDQGRAASAAVERAFGTPLPSTPAVTTGRELQFVWSGPAHWLALGPDVPGHGESRIAAALEGTAAVCDQGGSRRLLEIGGPRARDVLAKGIELDLHSRAFKAGDAAVTTASHIGVHLWQVTDEPVYRMLVVHTYFGSLWTWLSASDAEYGCEVQPAGPYASHA
jgi:sarcosine oxidase subunit gamma